jgi:hypothetical protein
MFRKAAHSKVSFRSGTVNAALKSSSGRHWTEREVDEGAFKDAHLVLLCQKFTEGGILTIHARFGGGRGSNRHSHRCRE